ncbi:MAG: sigma-70 family RNA polymerase sigma factor [Myxococcaceae bacterium]|nr:sigma-70 family RNA polymerase sigma factor [Myxococcaceae bacterium]
MLDAGELFERYHGTVYRRCLALLRDRDDAAEALQEVFEKAISGLGRFRLQAAPLTWLYAIATRHCLQTLRNRSSHELKAVLLVEPGTFVLDETRGDVQRTLEQLSLAELELVAHAYRDGLTQDEIAEVTRQSRKTVGKKLKALSDKLRLQLKADAETPQLEKVTA